MTDISFGHLRTMAVVGPALDISVAGGLGEDGVEDVLGDVVAGIVVVDGYQLTHLGLSSSFKATMGDNDLSGDDTTNSIQSIG